MVTSHFKVLLEFTGDWDYTIITSADEKSKGADFDMVEFGEQLRTAREKKGMTQQSLAEQLYVTRQAVSRWECGDRYPDLLTTKKISLILDVSLDELLSENEMEKVVERNPVIEKPLANNIMIALYAFIVFSFAVTAADIIIRLPINANTISFGKINIQAVALNLAGLIIQIIIFAYGLVNALKWTLSPKRMGAIITLFFASMCLTDFNRLLGNTVLQVIFLSAMLIIPSIMGAIGTYLYFIKAKAEMITLLLIFTASVWGIVRMIISSYEIICYASEYVSMNTALGILLKLCIYTLVIYQAYTLHRKRRNASKPNSREDT